MKKIDRPDRQIRTTLGEKKPAKAVRLNRVLSNVLGPDGKVRLRISRQALLEAARVAGKRTPA